MIYIIVETDWQICELNDFVDFFENIFWAYLINSRLNDISHWYVHSDLLFKFEFKLLAEVLALWTMKDSNV